MTIFRIVHVAEQLAQLVYINDDGGSSAGRVGLQFAVRPRSASESAEPLKLAVLCAVRRPEQ